MPRDVGVVEGYLYSLGIAVPGEAPCRRCEALGTNRFACKVTFTGIETQRSPRKPDSHHHNADETRTRSSQHLRQLP